MDGPINGIYQRVIETAAPAAGAESITTVPAGKYWRITTFIATLTADATVASRAPVLVIDDGANILYRVNPGGTITASSAVALLVAVIGSTQSSIAGVQLSTPLLPDPTFFVLQPGWRIRTLTTAIVAGDQWGEARLIVQEFAG